MVVIQAIFIDVFEIGRLFVEWVDFGLLKPVTEHLWKGALISDLNYSNATWFKNTIQFFNDGRKIIEMMRSTNHEKARKLIVFEWSVIDVTLDGIDAVPELFLSLIKFSLGVIKKSGGLGTVEIFLSEATIATSNIYEGIHLARKKTSNRETVCHIFILTISIFPKDFFIIIAIIVGDDFLVLLCHGNDYTMR